MGPTSLVNVSSQNIANDLAMIVLMIRSPTIVLWLMNMSGALGCVGWLDQQRLHNRSRPRHLRWLMVHKHWCLMNLAVRQCKVVAQFEVLREPIFGSNFAIFFVVFCPLTRQK